SREKGDQIYINTLYTAIVTVGGLWSYKSWRFYADIHGGILYTNYIRELDNLNDDIRVETVAAGGFSLGLQYKWKNATFKIESSVASTTDNEITTLYAEFNYRLGKNWQAGLFYERASRAVNLCEDKNDPLCKYVMQLNYGAIYLGWKFYKKHWFLFGLGASNLELGYGDAMTRKTTGSSIYLSYR
ncbi:hypothetical protein KJ865_11860, partial [Myxococcota bacterium]|nr:hypothetical protein [Myxococcota bacterium]